LICKVEGLKIHKFFSKFFYDFNISRDTKFVRVAMPQHVPFYNIRDVIL